MDLSPGWRPDPTGHHLERWWDGQEWTDRVRSGETETVQTFETAMALPVPGEDLHVPLWRRRLPRLLAAGAVVAVAVGLAAGPLINAADDRPPAARAGTADKDGLTTASFALVDLATRGQWSAAAHFWPSPTDEERATIGSALRSCLGEDVLDAKATLFTYDPPEPESAGGAVEVTADLAPRLEQLVEALHVRFTMEHRDGRWVVAGPFEQAIEDQPLTACPGLPTG